eukprot:gene2914-3631_t
MESNQNKQLVWYITGGSRGFGLVFIKRLLELDQFVVATSRNKEELYKAVFNDGDEISGSPNFLGIQVDLVNETNVKESIEKAVEKFGRIDVVINNAAYAIQGSLEEISDQEVRGVFDINVFGVLNVLRHVTPVLRKQRSGHVINISSSITIFGPIPGMSNYKASKCAIDGFTDCYAEEVRPFGIKAFTINAGAFRTDFLTKSLQVSKNRTIQDYTAVVHQNYDRIQQYRQQPGDPNKLFNVIQQIVFNPPQESGSDMKIPSRLCVGPDCYMAANRMMDNLKKSLSDWDSVATKTNLDSIPFGTLPSQTLQELVIRISKYDPGLLNPSNIFEIGSIPSTVTKLNIQHFLFKHNIKIIPGSITNLTVSDWNLSIVEEGSLPSSPSIRTLVLEIDGGGYREYSENIKEKKWPSQFFPPNLNVFKVIGRTEGYSIMYPGDLPHTIKELTVKPKCIFHIGSIPNSVEILELPKRGINQILEPEIIASGCKSVNLESLEEKLKIGSIPDTLSRVSISESKQLIYFGILPTNLTHLVASYDTTFMLRNSGPTFAELFPLLEYFK